MSRISTIKPFTRKKIPVLVIIVLLLAVTGSIALAGQGRSLVKTPDSVAFSGFRG
jgi:hypothetical protein